MNLHPQDALGVTLGIVAFIFLLAAIAYPLYRIKAARLGYKYGDLKTWRLWHFALGGAFVVLMLLHGGFAWPNDWLTGLVFALTWFIALGGALWWGLQTFIPRKLAKLREPVLFERIPEVHRHLLELGEKAQARSDAQVQRFYRENWLPAMREIKFSLTHFFHAPVDDLSRAVAATKPLLRSEEHEIVNRLHELYAVKLELEASYNLQLVLRNVHLFHGPAAFILLALALVHAWSVLVF